MEQMDYEILRSRVLSQTGFSKKEKELAVSKLDEAAQRCGLIQVSADIDWMARAVGLLR